MFVNTKIVNALLTLRCITRSQLCAVAGISVDALSAWLDETSEDSDDRLSFDRQLEVLKVLGVVGETPRRDVVHNWTIRERAFGSSDSAYEPLRLILSCFGRAEVVHLVAETDSLLSFSSHTYFGLTFAKFRAILEIITPAFQSLSFSPESLPNLSWAATGSALVLPVTKFQQLIAPGEATPASFDQERVAALEQYQWQKLVALTRERGVGATEVVKLVLDALPTNPALPKPDKPKRKTSTVRKRRAMIKAATHKAEETGLSTSKTASQVDDSQPQPSHTGPDVSQGA